MEAKQNAAANQDNFEPLVEWSREEASDTLLVYLPGLVSHFVRVYMYIYPHVCMCRSHLSLSTFILQCKCKFHFLLYTQVSSLSVFSIGSSKEKIRIEVTSAKKLRVSGEQPRTHGAGGSRRRFEKEFPIPPNCDVNAITANFVQGILYVKLPKKPVTLAVPVTTKPEKPPKQPTPEESSAVAAPAVAPSQQKKEPISDSGKEDVSKKSAEGRDVESKKSNGAGYEAPKTTLEKEKDKGLVDEEKKSVSQESDGKLAELAAKADGRGKTVSATEGETGRGKDGGEAGGLEGLAMVVKEPKRLINLVVGLLLVVVFALYVKDVIFQSLKGGSKRAEL